MNSQSTTTPGQQHPLTHQHGKQVDFLLAVTDDVQKRTDLLQLIERVRGHVEAADPTKLVCQMAELWLHQPGRSFEQYKQDVSQVMTLLSFFSTIRSDYFCFENNTRYVQCLDSVEEGGQADE